jgi:hypothetical protein
MTPESLHPVPETPVVGPPRRNRVLRYCFALFTMEVGLFLLIFPWTDTWYFNYLQDSNALFRTIWEDPYFRGGISGLGVVNIYLSIVEFLRTLRGI